MVPLHDPDFVKMEEDEKGSLFVFLRGQTVGG